MQTRLMETVVFEIGILFLWFILYMYTFFTIKSLDREQNDCRNKMKFNATEMLVEQANKHVYKYIHVYLNIFNLKRI